MTKNILHITYSFFPHRGWSETLIMPILREHTKTYNTTLITLDSEEGFSQYEGINVYTIAYNDDISFIHTRFLAILAHIKPDVILFHCYNVFSDTTLINTIKSSQPKIKTLFMYHHPSATCLRGDLVKYGKEICTGELKVNDCTACTANHLGLPQVLAKSLNYLPSTKEKISWLPSKLATLISMRKRVEKTVVEKLALFKSFDYILTINHWSKQLLLLNGIAAERIIVMPIATPANPITIKQTNPNNKECLKLIYVGRLSSEKGVHNVVKAISLFKGSYNILFDVYGIYGNDKKYNHDLEKLINKTKNICYKGILDEKLVIDTMAQYDVVIVSSITCETGPLTVLEAFAANKIVLGTDINGINEMVEDGKNGYLVKYNDVDDWYAKLLMLYNEKMAGKNHSASLAPNRYFSYFIGKINNFLEQVITES